MKLHSVALIILFASLCVFSQSASIKKKSTSLDADTNTLLDFYHTNDQIEAQLTELADSCDYLKLSKSGTDPELGVATLTNSSSGNEDKTRVFLLFGEHARELITAETALHFIKSVCGKTDLFKKSTRTSLMDKSEIRLVYNANPKGRLLVQQGEHCQRENTNSVDLNRNWSAHWREGYPNNEDYPGTAAFSENETQTLKSLVDDFKPDLFATYHSGTYGVYSPYAYSRELGKNNIENMETVMNEVNDKHCKCESGAAGATVGYICPGTSLDYVYDTVATPYSFAFEIYTPSFSGAKFIEDNLSRYVKDEEKTASFLETKSTLGSKLRGQAKHSKGRSCFISTADPAHEEAPELMQDMCATQFNPTDEVTYTFIVNNWSDAIYHMVLKVQEITAEESLTAVGSSFDPY